MKVRYSRILLTHLAVVGLAALTVLFVLLLNAKNMLEYYGLSSSGSVIKQSAGSTLSTGLTKVDKLSFTGPVVTFAIWAIIGVFCFSLVQGIARIYHEIEADKELSSNNYIHPDSFARGSFWHRVLLDFTGVFGCVLLLFGLLYLLIAQVIANTVDYTQPFLLGAAPRDAGHFVLGLVIMYVWLLAFASLLKLFINRHRLAVGSR